MQSLERWKIDPRAALRAGLARLLYLALLLLPVAVMLLSLTQGLYELEVEQVAEVLAAELLPGGDEHEVDALAHTIVWRIRMPRVLAALLIGATLAGTGTAFQGIFKNPLVDSGLLGVTAGAGFGAAWMLSEQGTPSQVQAAAFAFGLLAVMITYLGSRLVQSSNIIVLTLMGVLVGSFFTSLISLLKYLADPLDELPAITFWLLGSLVDVTWDDLPFLITVTLAGGVLLWLLRWRLNILSLGDAEATALGINAERLKILIIVCATLMTAMAVSVAGVIGWVGLVIPHAGRLLVGPEHKRLIPISFSLGAAFLLTIDSVSRTQFEAEVPIGVLTGLIGVPVLLVLLARNRTGW
jgi:iron complex transport system permease protein